MAKKAYIGVDGKARKVKKMYIGVDGVARKIKKAYIGVGGVARPCFTGGELAYYGEAEILGMPRASPAATTVGNRALFGGGGNLTYVYSTVDVYDESLTWDFESLSEARRYLAARSV